MDDTTRKPPTQDAAAISAFSGLSGKIQPLLLCMVVSALIGWPASVMSRWMAASCVVFVTLTNVVVLLAQWRVARRGRALADEAARRAQELRRLHADVERSLASVRQREELTTRRS